MRSRLVMTNFMNLEKNMSLKNDLKDIITKNSCSEDEILRNIDKEAELLLTLIKKEFKIRANNKEYILVNSWFRKHYKISFCLLNIIWKNDSIYNKKNEYEPRKKHFANENIKFHYINTNSLDSSAQNKYVKLFWKKVESFCKNEGIILKKSDSTCIFSPTDYIFEMIIK